MLLLLIFTIFVKINKTKIMKKLFYILLLLINVTVSAQVTPVVPVGDAVGSIIEFKNREYLFVFGAYPEIKVTDGTSNPIKSVKLFPNGASIRSSNKTENHVFFAIPTGSGDELYSSDGTNEILTKILTIPNEQIYLSPTINLTGNQYDKKIPLNYIGDKLIFNSKTATSNFTSSLWVSDGTSGGTFKLTSSLGEQLDVLHDSYGNKIAGNIYFSAKIAGNSDTYYLWKTDGTIAGTSPVLTNLSEKLFTTTKSTLVNLNNELVFIASTNSAMILGDLYKTNGTSSGTIKLFSIPYHINYQNVNANKFIGKIFKNKFYFYGNDNTLGDYYLYETDGTIAGTKLVKNTGDGNINIKVPNVEIILIEDGNYLYFSGKGRKWLTPTFSFAWDFYFATDGASTKTIDEVGNFPTISNLSRTQNGIIINLGNNSCRLNGWEKPTKTSFTSTQLNILGSAFIHKNKMFFPAAEGSVNNELWVTDGTQLGTKKFAEIAPGTLNSDVKYFFEINDVLYFMARQGNAAPFYIYKLGEDYTFNGSVSNSLNNSQNWNSGSIPTSVDLATIPEGYNTIMDNSLSVNEMNVNSPIEITSGNLNITENLNLGAKIKLNNNNLVLKGSNSQIKNGNSTNYIVTNGTGKVNVENLNTDRGTINLPIGTETNYNPVSLSNLETSDTFSARVAEGVSGTTIPAVNTTWEISETIPGGSNANITLGWNQSQETSGFTTSNAKVMHFVGGNWMEENSGTATGNNPFSISATGISSFSPFAVMAPSVTTTNDILKYRLLIYSRNNDGEFTIETDREMLGAKVNIYTTTGQRIISFQHDSSISNHKLKSGIYIIQMEKNEIKINKKLIIN